MFNLNSFLPGFDEIVENLGLEISLVSGLEPGNFSDSWVGTRKYFQVLGQNFDKFPNSSEFWVKISVKWNEGGYVVDLSTKTGTGFLNFYLD